MAEEKSPSHHFCSLSAACLLHNSHGVLRVVQLVQEEPHRGVKVPGRLVGHHRLLVLPVSLIGELELNLGRGDVGEEAADLGPVLELDVEVGGLVVVLGLRTGGMGLCSGTHS